MRAATSSPIATGRSITSRHDRSHTDDCRSPSAALTPGAGPTVSSAPRLDPPVAVVARRPTVRFMLSHPAHAIALGFGSGLSPVAPGTMGTLWAWLAYLVLQRWLGPAAMGVVIAGSLAVGWWACTVTAANMRVLDPGSIVWDEVIAFWIVLWLVMPAGFWAQFAAFA